MTCQQQLMNEGKPYPRTCQECGLGPCKHKLPEKVDRWQPISSAPKVAGVEIIGSRWARKPDGQMVCIQEPFISFYSPTLGRFYVDPTHWTPLPEAPND